MKQHSKSREILFAVAFLLVTALLLQLVSAVLRPAHRDYGSTWGAYLAEPKDSMDLLYLGSSCAYCDVNPALVYAASGLTGYVMAGSEQTLAITYHYLKEALKTQSPKAVLLEGTALFFRPYENYTQINIGYMPPSMNKLDAILNTAEPDKRAGLLFDLSLYHSRWKELRPSDLKRALTPIPADPLKGHTAVDTIQEGAGVAPNVADRAISPEVYAANLGHLADILALCRAHDILPIITFNPAYSRCTPAAYEKAAADIAALDPGALVYNWTDAFGEIGLTPGLHLYDDMHLNQDGAAIFSRWLGDFLHRELGLVPMDQSPENAQAWQAAEQHWTAQIAQ
ncbi:MAG: hypothetical protein RR281_00960 [Pseudoflavonifractor sp.]